jgi:hypothetical protein
VSSARPAHTGLSDQQPDLEARDPICRAVYPVGPTCKTRSPKRNKVNSSRMTPIAADSALFRSLFIEMALSCGCIARRECAYLVPPADELTKASAELDQDARLNVYRQQGG